MLIDIKRVVADRSKRHRFVFYLAFGKEPVITIRFWKIFELGCAFGKIQTASGDNYLELNISVFTVTIFAISKLW